MIAVARMARRLAWSADPRQRWRQLSVIGGTALAVVILATAASVVAAMADTSSRLASRGPFWADSEQSAALFLVPRGYAYAGHDLTILWIEPAPGHENDPNIVPPGLSAFPEPGTAVLSPGAKDLGLTADLLGSAPSDRGTGPNGTIGLEGMSTISEALVYLRPAPGRSLGSGGSLLPFTGYSEDQAGAVPFYFTADPAFEQGWLKYAAVALFLVFPGLLVAMLSARALSPARNARVALLFRFGISIQRLRALLAVETAFLAVPGALLGSAVHAIFISRMTWIPVTGTVLQPGAMAIGGWTVVVAAATVVAAVGSASLGRLIARPGRAASRRPSPMALIPVTLGAVVTGGSGAIASRMGIRQDDVYAVGVIILALGVPLAIPAITWMVGALARRSRHPARWLAARAVVLSPRNLSRPASMLALLLMLGASSVSVAAEVLSGVGSGGSRAVSADWRDERPGDMDALRAAVSSVGGDAVIVQWNDNGDQWMVVDSCTQLEAVADVVGQPCTSDGEMTDKARGALEDWTGISVGDLDLDLPDEGAAVLFLPRGTSITEVVAAGAGELPAFNPSSVGQASTVRTAIRWFVAGWLAATALLTVVLLRELGDRSMATAEWQGRLMRLSLHDEEIEDTAAWTMILPLAAAIPLGYGAGLLTAWAGEGAEVTRFLPTWITGYSAVVLALATGVMLATVPLRWRWARLSAGENGRHAGSAAGVT